MAPVDKPEDTEPDDEKAGADLDLALPFDQGDQQREGNRSPAASRADGRPLAAKARPAAHANSFPSIQPKRRAAIPFPGLRRGKGRSR
jgi:hypothetical protein